MKWITCQDCSGSGYIECDVCEGTGADLDTDRMCRACYGDGAFDCESCESIGGYYSEEDDED